MQQQYKKMASEIMIYFTSPINGAINLDNLIPIKGEFIVYGKSLSLEFPKHLFITLYMQYILCTYYIVKCNVYTIILCSLG